MQRIRFFSMHSFVSLSREPQVVAKPLFGQQRNSRVAERPHSRDYISQEGCPLRGSSEAFKGPHSTAKSGAIPSGVRDGVGAAGRKPATERHLRGGLCGQAGVTQGSWLCSVPKVKVGRLFQPRGQSLSSCPTQHLPENPVSSLNFLEA